MKTSCKQELVKVKQPKIVNFQLNKYCYHTLKKPKIELSITSCVDDTSYIPKKDVEVLISKNCKERNQTKDYVPYMNSKYTSWLCRKTKSSKAYDLMAVSFSRSLVLRMVVPSGFFYELLKQEHIYLYQTYLHTIPSYHS